ncbi:iron uptake porin [Trichothermofontia sp.]
MGPLALASSLLTIAAPVAATASPPAIDTPPNTHSSHPFDTPDTPSVSATSATTTATIHPPIALAPTTPANAIAPIPPPPEPSDPVGRGGTGTLASTAIPIADATKTAKPAVPKAAPSQGVKQLTRRSRAQRTSVTQLSDVQPTDWAFQALQSLVERYGVIAGYPDGTFRGNRAMTRYEFAAGLNAALDRVSELIAEGLADKVSKEDLEALQRLQAEFATELATLRGRTDALEGRVGLLEMLQFSTTTKLSGQAIFALNAGFQDGDSVIDAQTFDRISGSDPNTTFFSRVRLNLNTTFTGKDLLLTQLQAVTSTGTPRSSNSPGLGYDAADFLGDRSSSLFYSQGVPGANNTFQLNRLRYTFPINDDLQVAIFPRSFPTDFIDYNTFANRQGDNADNFSTESLTNNILLFALDNPAAGAAVTWNPNGGGFTFRAVYTAQDPAVPNPTGLGGAPIPVTVTDIYGNPDRNNRGGLFGDPNIGFLEAEYNWGKGRAIRLQYAGGSQGGSRFEAIGANLEYAFTPKVGFFGRFGYSPNFLPIPFEGIAPTYWAAGLAFPDLFKEGNQGGIAIAQPLIFQHPDIDHTQTNYEVYYNYRVSDQIRITPLLQVITHPLSQSENGTVVTGTLRTVFSF